MKISDRLKEKHIIYNDIYRIFRESYVDLNIPAYEKMVDEIYKDPENYEDIAWDLGLIFLYDKDLENPNSPNTLIWKASYNLKTGKFYVFLSEKALDGIDEGKNKEEFKKELIRILVHEDTHRQQDQGKNKEQSYIGDFDSKNEDSSTLYFSQKFEIDAFARSVGRGIIDAQITLAKVLKLLPSKPEKRDEFSLRDFRGSFRKIYSKYKLDPQTVALIAEYYLIGGDVWKRFLKRLYEYLPESYRH